MENMTAAMKDNFICLFIALLRLSSLLLKLLTSKPNAVDNNLMVYILGTTSPDSIRCMVRISTLHSSASSFWVMLF
jgi:hypothetical protein